MIYKNFTPLISNKSANKLNYYKSKNFPVISQTFSQNISSFENNKLSFNYSKTEENYLQDSLKKMDLKRSFNQIAIRTDNRILKNSISQRIFDTIKLLFYTSIMFLTDLFEIKFSFFYEYG